MREVKVVLLPGDGIGPEVVGEARRLVDHVANLDDIQVNWESHAVGGCAIDSYGKPLPDGVLEACAASDAILLGAVGGPKWDTTNPDDPRPEQALLALRAGLGLFANLRPVKPIPSLYESSPLRTERIEGTDLLVVRELTGGIYFGTSGREGDTAFDTCTYSRQEIRRVAEVAFESALARRGKVTSVDKANVLESSRLWRDEVNRVAAEHPDVELEHMLVDNAAMQLVSRPSDFDVIVTENMFGDILSDEAAMISGSIGLLPSASLGGHGPGLYEPVHGSAPDIADLGISNPIATCLSAAMMLRYSLDAPHGAAAIETAVDTVLGMGHATRDLGGTVSTHEMGELLISAAG
jgi:3-isopropylmalate dehydrogenase